jgi:ABC-type multidrug transport system fused ATPase/permease subunit
VLLLTRAGTAGQLLQAAYQGLMQSMPFIERTQEVERRYSDSRPVDGGVQLPSVRTVAFDRVSFSYNPGRPVLSDITFEVTGGEVIGIVGPSGAGKSSLVQLLLQLRVPDEGRYLVNGVPVEQFSRDDWHRQVSYVPQEPRLLHASVAENIRFFRDIEDEDVERAALLARIHDDVVSWPQGYDTLIGPRADAVSGGQQQRICLARALAARPEVLVLDEPTSALDTHSEHLLLRALDRLMAGRTTLIIAHRLSTIRHADQILVLDHGRIVERGTHAELRARKALYADLVGSPSSRRTRAVAQ